MSVTKKNSNITLMLMYLYRLVTVFKDYFGELHGSRSASNFVIIYELMDETWTLATPGNGLEDPA